MAGLIAEFERLTASLPRVSPEGLRAATQQALERLSNDHEYFGPNIKVAQEIAQRLYLLIESFESLNEEQRRLVTGAVHYFSLTEDRVSDLTPLVGLDDDIEVLNFVLMKLGRAAEIIEI